MTKEKKPFTYHVGDIDKVIDSRGNTVILLRNIAWGESKEKLELRKWVIDVNKETALKGVSFLTEEGPNNLVNTLLELGYGNTKEVLTTLHTRPDFKESLKNLGKKNNAKSDLYIDPKEILHKE